VSEETNYPWDGNITLRLDPQPAAEFSVYLRIPGWCREPYRVIVNGQPVDAGTPVRGYVAVRRRWQPGDWLRLELPMTVRREYAHPLVRANVGRTALTRGPLVYCIEQADHPDGVRNVYLPADAPLEARIGHELGEQMVVIRGEAAAVTGYNEDGTRSTRPAPIVAIPYFAWNNRRPGEMVVWIAERPELAEIPGEVGVQLGNLWISGSHCNATDTLEALADQRLPQSSGDHSLPRMTWWDHRGTTEWVAYRFPQPRRLSRCAVYWFDDTGRGACRVPQSWRLLWRDGQTWRPVELKPGHHYTTSLDQWNQIEFEPVTTTQMRLEVQLRPGFSGGILEWRVE
jgi:hypothetical protein